MESENDYWWIPDDNEVWVKAIKSSSEQPNGLTSFTTINNKKSINKSKGNCYQSNNSLSELDYKRSDLLVDDLMTINEVNPGIIFHILRNRFMNGLIYTKCGDILITINPFDRNDSLYSIDTMNKFNSSITNTSSPHIYSIPKKAYQSMCSTHKNQIIFITGETGSGKSETMKECLKFLNRMNVLTNNEKSYESSKISSVNTVIESFTHAKTSRNTNSTRNCSYIELQFKRVNDHYIYDTLSVSLFYYERNRTTCHMANERNYHIFYQLLRGLSSTELKSWYLPQDTTFFRYLRHQSINSLSMNTSTGQRGSINNPRNSINSPTQSTNSSNTLHEQAIDLNDSENLLVTINALQSIGFSLADIYSMFQLLSIILLIGNIEFIKSSNSSSDSKLDIETFEQDESVMINHSNEIPNYISELLKVSTNMLESSICSRVVESGVRRSIFTVKHNAARASQIRDSLSKLIYDKLLLYIVNHINSLNHNVLNEHRDRYTRETINLPIDASYIPTSEYTQLSTYCASNNVITPVVTPNKTIGFINYYGFELFESNSFDQLVINYTNELLFQSINSFHFSIDSQLYISEGLQVAMDSLDIDMKDNSPIIREIEIIFKSLDDEIKQSKGSSRSWYDRYRKSTVNTSIISYFPKKESFIVSHYNQNKVEYLSFFLLDRNFDNNITNEISTLLSSSENSFVQRIFNFEKGLDSLNRDNVSVSKLSRPGSFRFTFSPDTPQDINSSRQGNTIDSLHLVNEPITPKIRKNNSINSPNSLNTPSNRKLSLSSINNPNMKSINWFYQLYFKRWLQTISETKEYNFLYIKCLKSNHLNSSNTIDNKLLNSQINVNNLVSLLHYQINSYKHYILHHDFISNYKVLIEFKDRYIHWFINDFVDILKDRLKIENKLIQISKNYVFLSEKIYSYIETLCNQLFNQSALKIQRNYRMHFVIRYINSSNNYLSIPINELQIAFKTSNLTNYEITFNHVSLNIKKMQLLTKYSVLQHILDKYSDLKKKIIMKLQFLDDINKRIKARTLQSFNELKVLLENANNHSFGDISNEPIVITAKDTINRYTETCKIYEDITVINDMTIEKLKYVLDLLCEFKTMFVDYHKVKDYLTNHIALAEREIDSIYYPMLIALENGSVNYDEQTGSLVPAHIDDYTKDPLLSYLIQIANPNEFHYIVTKHLYEDCKHFLNLRDRYSSSNDYTELLSYLSTFQPNTLQFKSQYEVFVRWADAESSTSQLIRCLTVGIIPSQLEATIDTIQLKSFQALIHKVENMSEHSEKVREVLDLASTVLKMRESFESKRWDDLENIIRNIKIPNNLSSYLTTALIGIQLPNYLQSNKLYDYPSNQSIDLLSKYPQVIDELKNCCFHLLYNKFDLWLKIQLNTNLFSFQNLSNILSNDLPGYITDYVTNFKEDTCKFYIQIKKFIGLNDFGLSNIFKNDFYTLELLNEIRFSLIDKDYNRYIDLYVNNTNDIWSNYLSAYKNIDDECACIGYLHRLASILDQLDISLNIHKLNNEPNNQLVKLFDYYHIKQINYQKSINKSIGKAFKITKNVDRVTIRIFDEKIRQTAPDERIPLPPPLPEFLYEHMRYDMLSNDDIEINEGNSNEIDIKLIDDNEFELWHDKSKLTNLSSAISRILTLLDSLLKDLSIRLNILSKSMSISLFTSQSTWIGKGLLHTNIETKIEIAQVVDLLRKLVIDGINSYNYNQSDNYILEALMNDTSTCLSYVKAKPTDFKDLISELNFLCQYLFNQIFEYEIIHNILGVRRLNNLDSKISVHLDIYHQLHERLKNLVDIYIRRLTNRSTLTNGLFKISILIHEMTSHILSNDWVDVLNSIKLSTFESLVQSITTQLQYLSVISNNRINENIAVYLDIQLVKDELRYRRTFQSLNDFICNVNISSLSSMDLSSWIDTVDSIQSQIPKNYSYIYEISSQLRQVIEMIVDNQSNDIKSEIIERLLFSYSSNNIITKNIETIINYVRIKQFIRNVNRLLIPPPMTVINGVDIREKINKIKKSIIQLPNYLSLYYETSLFLADTLIEIDRLTSNDSTVSWVDIINKGKYLEELLEQITSIQIDAISNKDKDDFLSIIRNNITKCYSIGLSYQSTTKSSSFHRSIENFKVNQTNSSNIRDIVRIYFTKNQLDSNIHDSKKQRLISIDKLNPSGIHCYKQRNLTNSRILQEISVVNSLKSTNRSANPTIELKFLWAYDFEVSLLRKLDKISLLDLQSVGYSCLDLFIGGYSINHLRKIGFKASDFIRIGCNILQLQNAFFTYDEILYSGASINELRKHNYDILSLVSNNPSTLTLKQLVRLGYLPNELKKLGYSLSNLKKYYPNLSVDAILQAGFNVEDIVDCGYQPHELIQAGLTYKDIRKYFDYNQLIDGNLSNYVVVDILKEFYFKLQGNQWINKTNWLNEDIAAHPYFGVTCDIDSNTKLVDVVSIDLSNNQLTGAVTNKLKFLKKLKSVNLSNNNINDIPIEILQLCNIQFIDLSNNPNIKLSEDIIIRYSNKIKINDPSKSITVPRIDVDISTGSTVDLNKLIDRQIDTQITDKFDIKNIDSMVELPMNTSESLEFNALMSLFLTTDGLKWTRNTNWGSNKPISKWFGIKTNSYNKITEISLPNNNLCGYLSNQLFTNLLDIQIINLKYNNLHNNLPDSIYNCRHLIKIYLHCNDLSGILSEEIKNLANLQILDIRSNRFTGYLPSNLKYCRSLSYFAISSNEFYKYYNEKEIRLIVPGCRIVKV